MARTADVIDDATPLQSASVDVPRRVGWLLRTCRLNAPGAPTANGGAFAEALGVSPATITRWEKATEDIDAAGLEGYEQVLGLAPGSLRGLVEMTRRTFRQPSRRRTRRTGGWSLAEASAWAEPAMTGVPRGIDWLHLADLLNGAEGIRLPTFVARPVLARLVHELALSLDTAYFTRYEATAQLRSGPYGDLVLEVIWDFVAAEHVQICADLFDAAAVRADEDLLKDMCEALVDARPAVHAGAAHALSNMAAVGAVSKVALREAVPMLVHAYNLTLDEPARHRLMSDLFRSLPRGVLATARKELAQPLAPHAVDISSVDEDSVSYRAAWTLGQAILAELPHPSDRMLHRLLFEAMFDPRWAKAHMARCLLMSLPYREVVARHAADLAESAADEDVREGATRLIVRLGGDRAVTLAQQSLCAGDDDKCEAALVTLAHAADHVDPAVLRTFLDHGGELARRALYAAGMTGCPALTSWAEDATLSEQVRGGARWWLAQGSRVTDR